MSVEDLYEYDPPEARKSWADLFQENRETVKSVGTVVAIPTGLFVLTCVANYFIKKKVESL
jgi:hypothetical protein